MRDTMFLAAVIAIIPMALGWPYICISFWAYVSLLDPNSFLYGIGTMVPYAKVAAGMTLLSLLVSREKNAFHCDRTTALVLVFLVIAALSQFTSLADASVGWDILDKLWKIVALNLLVVCCVRTRLRIHVLLLTICLGVGFNGTGEALKYLLSGAAHKVEGVPNWGDNNQVALIVLMTMPILAYIREVSEARLLRLGALAGIILFAVCVIATTSRGGLAGLLILALAGIATTRHKVRYLAAMLIAGMVLVQTVPESWTQRMDTIQSADQDSSFMGRVIVWKLSTLIALDHPLLGGGLHAVQSLNVWNAYVPSFGKLSFIPTDAPDLSPHAAHSIYFEVLGDTGILGLSVFLGIMASCFLTGFRIKAAARNRPDLQWAARLASMLQLSLLSFLSTGALLSAAYHDLVFLVVALFSAVNAAVAAAPSVQAPTDTVPQVAGWRARRLDVALPRWRLHSLPR
ncbi:MAG: putative O-glycosylation ligase, exosortase A system-associated [Rhodopila sp.]|jgi:probable O-glycosylation ligase (exosortase A-associated)